MSIPILGDIPILGYFFRNKEKIRDKVNLVVILTPFIIKNSKDMEKLRHTLYRLNKLEEKYYNILIHKLKVKEVKRSVKFPTNP
jgi:general secretion pathway protein D